jgi:hypothetical protein
MGVSQGHRLTYRLYNLSGERLLLIARKLHADSGLCETRLPSIYIDASWISRKFALRAGGPISAVMAISNFFASNGCYVTIVCDGAKRHDSKRASISRHAKRVEKGMNAYSKNALLICKKTELIAATGTEAETQLRKEIKILSDELNKAKKEQDSFVNVGQDFYEELREQVLILPLETTGGGYIRVVQAVFQADTVIGRACVRKKCNIALMTDTDLAVYAGRACVGVEDFKLSSAKKRTQPMISGVSLFSGFKATIYDTICRDAIHCSWLVKTKVEGAKQQNIPFIVDAAFPLFDGVDDPSIRALYAVIAGNSMCTHPTNTIATIAPVAQ